MPSRHEDVGKVAKLGTTMKTDNNTSSNNNIMRRTTTIGDTTARRSYRRINMIRMIRIRVNPIVNIVNGYKVNLDPVW